MVRTNKSKSAERIGKGKVTPMQVAFLVDRYLCDNRFLETRSVFRSEASSLISKSPLREVPCSLIPLDDILNEYISLKEQKVIVDQEKARLDQEKTRVQNLLNGMQDVMNVYNSTAAAAPPPAITAAAPTTAFQVSASTSQPNNNNIIVSPSGGTVHHSTPNLMAASLPGNKRVGNFTAPSTTQSVTRKRKSPPEVSLGPPPVSNKGMKKIPRAAAKATTNYLTFQPSSNTQTPVDNNSVANDSSNFTSTVAKRLCYGSSSDMSPPPTNSAGPKTPQKQVSPQQGVTPTNCTILTKERITVSPHKQVGSFTVERSRIVSSFSPVKSSKRDHVKGRLNFDDDDEEATMHLDAPASGDLVSSSYSSGSGSEAEVDLFDIDFLSANFPFSEVLGDFDLDCEGMQDSCLPQPSNFHMETASGSSPGTVNENLVTDQVVSEYTSTVTEMIQEKDMNTQGSDSMTTVKSITKCLRILSPAKSGRQRSHN